MRPAIARRSAQRLIREGQRFEVMAARLRANFPNHARAIRQIASHLGDTGRSLIDEIEKGGPT